MLTVSTLIKLLTVRLHGEAMKLTKDMKQSRFRMPMELLVYLKEQAATNIRSVNAELVIRLMKSMEQDKREGRH